MNEIIFGKGSGRLPIRVLSWIVTMHSHDKFTVTQITDELGATKSRSTVLRTITILRTFGLIAVSGVIQGGGSTFVVKDGEKYKTFKKLFNFLATSKHD